jgi:hypothetical protein
MAIARAFAASLGDGAATTAYVARYPLATTALRVRRLPTLTRLEGWCASHAVTEALVGGFYVRWSGVPPAPALTGLPLGELRLDGALQPLVPFTHPWGDRRACLSVVGSEVRIARRRAP